MRTNRVCALDAIACSPVLEDDVVVVHRRNGVEILAVQASL